MRRRTFLTAATAAISGLVLAACADESTEGATARSTETTDDGRQWRMPDEGDRHERTWMAFGASERIWGSKLLPQVQRDLAAIATAIARFEPVSMLVRPNEIAVAQGLLSGADVELISAQIDDLWMRDTGPVFVGGPSNAWAGVDFNFNGWGGKQEHRRDATVAGAVTDRLRIERLRTELVLEGGGIEVDGNGTAIITESCVLNSNRNPGWSKTDVEKELAYLLGIEKVIWLPGIAGKDITDGHTDFYARFAGPGVVVAGLDTDKESFDYDVTHRHLDILRSATDAADRPLRVETLESPTTLRMTDAGDDFAAGYINFYVCNGAVIAPQFGDPDTDTAARDALARLFPDRQVVQLNIDGIAAGGGGIHCTTQQQPARSR